MPADRAEAYWEAIEVLEARETLLGMRLVSYPHLKKSSAQKFERTVQKAAFPRLDEAAEVVTTGDMGQALARLVNGG